VFTKVKTAEEVTAMRESGAMLATVLTLLKQSVSPGMATKELADMASAELKKLGGQPAFLGYHGFPDVLCVSLNNEVVHGIPSRKQIIAKGDIVSMDFGVRYRGMITDSAISVIAGGSAGSSVQKLVYKTEEAMLAAIDTIRDGVKVGDIANAAQTVLETAGLGIVRDLVGHGVGHELHEDPNIPNYGRKGTGSKLQAGMTVAIEPMATLGGHGVFVAHDGWTVMTQDGSRSAHFEHTVLVTRDGYEILTSV
jgi:methionyl aminopeptidase